MKLDGTLQARYDYDAYGRRMTITQNANYLGGCDFGYTGHFTRTALVAGRTELVLTHFRAYDPTLGRWLSEDPLGEMAGSNFYLYCNGDPLGYVDPDGRLANWIVQGAIGGVIGGLYGAVVAAANDEDILRGAVTGAVGGAVFAVTFNPAAAAGAASVIGAGVVAGAASGAASGIAGEMFDMDDPCEDASLGDVAEQIVYGAIGGAAGGALGPLTSKLANATKKEIGNAYVLEKIGNALYVETLIGLDKANTIEWSDDFDGMPDEKYCD